MGFKSVQESIDTTTPGGRLVFHVFSALAQFELEMVRERTMAGLASARERGRLGGRPTVLTPAKLKQAQRMLRGGHPGHRSGPGSGGQPGHPVPAGARAG